MACNCTGNCHRYGSCYGGPRYRPLYPAPFYESPGAADFGDRPTTLVSHTSPQTEEDIGP